MTVRSTIAVIYVIAAALAALISGPGATGLASELAVFSVFEAQAETVEPRPARAIAWEWDDPPAFETAGEGEIAADDLAPATRLY